MTVKMGILRCCILFISIFFVADVRHPSFDMIPQDTNMEDLESKSLRMHQYTHYAKKLVNDCTISYAI